MGGPLLGIWFPRMTGLRKHVYVGNLTGKCSKGENGCWRKKQRKMVSSNKCSREKSYGGIPRNLQFAKYAILNSTKHWYFEEENCKGLLSTYTQTN